MIQCSAIKMLSLQMFNMWVFFLFKLTGASEMPTNSTDEKRAANLLSINFLLTFFLCYICSRRKKVVNKKSVKV